MSKEQQISEFVKIIRDMTKGDELNCYLASSLGKTGTTRCDPMDMAELVQPSFMGTSEDRRSGMGKLFSVSTPTFRNSRDVFDFPSYQQFYDRNAYRMVADLGSNPALLYKNNWSSAESIAKSMTFGAMLAAIDNYDFEASPVFSKWYEQLGISIDPVLTPLAKAIGFSKPTSVATVIQ